MHLNVYYEDLIQVFVLDDSGKAVPTMPGDTSWARSAALNGTMFTPDDGANFMVALADKLNHSTFFSAKVLT